MPNSKPVVSNTTPLITLAGVGLLHLLPAMFSEILIPEDVYIEYGAGRDRHPGSPDLDTLTWLSVVQVEVDRSVPNVLDAGEVATLTLARSSNARLVLLDERRARREAVALGLSVAGSISIIVMAKRNGLITAVTPILDEMISQGRRIGANLREQALRLAGE